MMLSGWAQSALPLVSSYHPARGDRALSLGGTVSRLFQFVSLIKEIFITNTAYPTSFGSDVVRLMKLFAFY